jgi:hypothetical protein
MNRHRDEDDGEKIFTCPISSHQLRWSINDTYGDLDSILRNTAFVNTTENKFDRIIASDCLFFRDFQLDLIYILRNAIHPTHGKIYLLQPRRGNTMDLFISKAQNYFDIELLETYNDEVCLYYMLVYRNTIYVLEMINYNKLM